MSDPAADLRVLLIDVRHNTRKIQQAGERLLLRLECSIDAMKAAEKLLVGMVTPGTRTDIARVRDVHDEMESAIKLCVSEQDHDHADGPILPPSSS